MSETDINSINGKWIVPKISKDFAKILKLIGYSKIARKFLKNNSITIESKLEEDKLSIIVDTVFYKNTKVYYLDGSVREYVDDNKNNIIEYSHRINDNSMQTTTVYVERNLTIVDTRELVSSDTCKHIVKAILENGDNMEIITMYNKAK